MASMALQVLDTKAAAYVLGGLTLIGAVYYIGRKTIGATVDFAGDVITYPFQEHETPDYHDPTTPDWQPFKDSIFEDWFKNDKP